LSQTHLRISDFVNHISSSFVINRWARARPNLAHTCDCCYSLLYLLMRKSRGKPLMEAAPHQVTRLLREWSDGDQSALEHLMPLVYDELHRLAHQHMQREKPGHLLQTSALINEAYVRLVDQPLIQWENRSHFFGIAARLMRRI